MDRIAKLYALYRYGIGGERENAKQKLIAALAPKTIEEYEKQLDDSNEVMDICFMRWKTATEKRLAIQVMVMFFDDIPKGRVLKSSLEIHAGKSKCAILKHTWALFLDAWRHESDLFYRAFIDKNDIFAATYKGGKDKKLSDADKMKMWSMAASIDRVNRNLAIENKG